MPRKTNPTPAIGPIAPTPRTPNPAEDNPRRKRRGRKGRKGRKGRRRNPEKNPKLSYGKAAMIGAVLGAVGVGIASAMRTVVLPIVTTSEGSFAVDGTTQVMKVVKGALRGAAIGVGVGLAAAVIAKEMGVGAMGRMMNPAGPGAAIALGTTMAATTMLADHGIQKAIAA